ncbi:hypothetical protein Taro_028138 [Colocasia esculenta]|uniref:Uncharacterized protein n=1 Tax=Colocasia esculenta TaxID=4460 RepID=A0A843VGF2_COLES|nr:hypothetical protein [Colocasia esculenta]
MTGVALGVPDATVIRVESVRRVLVAPGLPVAFLKRPVNGSRKFFVVLRCEEEGRAWCRGIVDLAWSEEEVANHREGPHWGSFFVKAVRRGFVVLPRLFARCLALEGLSRSEVVSIAWDPYPREPSREVSGLRVCSSWQPTGRTLKLRGKRGLDSGAESFVELSCLGLGRRGSRSAFLAQTRQSLVSLPLSALVPEPRRGVRREAAAWLGCGVASHGGYSLAVPSFRGRRWSGLGQTRASGGSRFGVLSVPWSRSWVPARDGTGVCSFLTWRCVRGPGWFYLWALDLVEFLLLRPVRDWALGVAFWLPPRSGLRLHVRRVSRAGRPVDVNNGKAMAAYVAFLSRRKEREEGDFSDLLDLLAHHWRKQAKSTRSSGALAGWRTRRSDSLVEILPIGVCPGVGIIVFVIPWWYLVVAEVCGVTFHILCFTRLRLALLLLSLLGLALHAGLPAEAYYWGTTEKLSADCLLPQDAAVTGTLPSSYPTTEKEVHISSATPSSPLGKSDGDYHTHEERNEEEQE